MEEKFSMKKIVNKRIEELSKTGELDISKCKNEFEKFFELFKIKDLPVDTFIDMLEKEDFNLNMNQLKQLEMELINRGWTNEDIKRNINNIKNIWNVK